MSKALNPPGHSILLFILQKISWSYVWKNTTSNQF